MASTVRYYVVYATVLIAVIENKTGINYSEQATLSWVTNEWKKLLLNDKETMLVSLYSCEDKIIYEIPMSQLLKNIFNIKLKWLQRGYYGRMKTRNI